MENCVILESEKLSIGGDPPKVLARLCTPCVTKNAPPTFAKSFTAYYKAMAEGFRAYLEGKLAPMAESKGETRPYGAVLNTVISLEGENILSLYTDAVLTMGEEKHCHRTAKLWSKDRGVLIKPGRFFVKGAVKKLLPLLGEAVGGLRETPPLYADWEKQLKKHFSPHNFYLCPKGIAFFYQGGRLCPLQKPFPLFLPMEAVKPYVNPDFLLSSDIE